MVVGAVLVLLALTVPFPGAALLGLATYLIPLLVVGLVLRYLRRMADSLENIERPLRDGEDKRRDTPDRSR